MVCQIAKKFTKFTLIISSSHSKILVQIYHPQRCIHSSCKGIGQQIYQLHQHQSQEMHLYFSHSSYRNYLKPALQLQEQLHLDNSTKHLSLCLYQDHKMQQLQQPKETFREEEVHVKASVAGPVLV